MDFATAKGLVTVIFLVFAVIEVIRGRFVHRGLASWRDATIDLVCAVALPLGIIPLIFSIAPYLAERLAPESADMLSHIPVWSAFGLLLIADDLTQYFWHRLSHSSWLYPLHRAHHSGRYLSVRVVYRNHFVYYLFMPGIWLSAVLVYWGLGSVYAIYIIAKMAVIISAHSSVPWDAPLYDRFPRMMWVVERVISTPATHSAHHGLHESDAATHYRGNYGNFLFLWDVVFGTARITRTRPTEFGIEDLEPVSLGAELLWFSAARTPPTLPDPTRPHLGSNQGPPA